jgi:hypothetical protein
MLLSILKSLVKVNIIMATLVVFSALCYGDGLPNPQPMQKIGSCPIGYIPYNEYCTPSKNANFAIVKNGACPSSYMPYGDYCVASGNARMAIHKESSSCPPSWIPYGNYCLAHN